MANTIILKRSSTASDVPTAGQLQQGELAINIADEKLYSKNSSDVVFEIAPGGSIWSENALFAEYLTAGASGGIRVGIDANQNFEIEHDGGSAFLRLDDDATTTNVEMIFDIESATTGDHGYRWRDQGVEVMELDLRFQRLSLWGAYDLFLWNSGNSNYLSLDQGGATMLTGANWTITNFKPVFAASSTARASINLPEGTAPTTPVDGDMWVTTTDAFVRVNGVSESIIGGGGGLNDVVDDLTPQLGGDLGSNTFDILMADNDSIYLGTGNDLRMYSDGTDLWFNTAAGGDWNLLHNSIAAINSTAGGAVSLYHNGNIALRTQTGSASGDTSRAEVLDANSTYRNVGFNEMPVREQDTSASFLRQYVGHIYHKDAAGTVTYTCDNDATIPSGAVWLVHNDATENLTIAQGTGVTVYWLAAGAAPVSGNVTVEQGGIVTVYRYTATEFWVWGAKEAAAGSVTWPLDPDDNEKILWGTGDDVEQYFDGTDLIFTTAIGTTEVDWAGFNRHWFRDGAAVRISDSGDTDYVEWNHDGTNLNETYVSTADKNITGLTGNYWIRDGAQLHVSDSTDTDIIKIYHSGSEGFFDVTNTTDMRFRVGSTGIEDSIICRANGSVELYEDNVLRLQTTTVGIDVEGGASTAAIDLTNGTSNIASLVWTDVGNLLSLKGLNHGDSIALAAENASGVEKTIITGDPDSTTSIYGATDVYLRVNNSATAEIAVWCDANGAVSVYHDGAIEFRTQQHEATGVTSGAEVYAHDGVFKDVGFNTLDVETEDVSDTLEAKHCGGVYFKDGTTAITLTLEANTSTDFPVGGVCTIINANTTGNITVTEGSLTTLYYLDGSTRTDTAGGCTVGPGGIATLWREASTIYYIWGGGITP